ncbi:MAG TPA: hypothetical protein VFI96_09355 [Longimicrobiaceae bacterium]|nr:hypothetical protein [Longimicrobiaceae bacterium]
MSVAFEVLPTEDLIARRCELAEQIDPLWQRLDAIDDELMRRRRALRRAQILTAPIAAECDGESTTLQPETVQ